MNNILIFFLLITVSGCATTNTMNRISLGMTKDQVIQKAGSPTSVSAQEKTEVFTYYLYQPFGQGMIEHPRENYFVRFYNGVVESYGKMGDFDSTKLPEQKITVDLNQKTSP